MPGKLLIALLMLLYAQGAQAQSDTTQQSKFQFDLTSGIYSQQKSLSRTGATDIKVPVYLQQRRPYEPDLAHTWGIADNLEATDNPLGHGASFLRFHTWYAVTEGIEVYGSLEVNNGGFSWGPYNTYNIAFLPRYYLTYEKEFLLKENPFSLQAKIGYLENFQNYEGLTEYNLDVQGLQASLKYGKLKFTTTAIADMQFMVGLNIDGIRDNKLSMEGLPIGRTLKADVSIGHEEYLGPFIGTQVLNLSGAFYKNNIRFYAQAGYRFNDLYASSQNYAYVAGLKGNLKVKKLTMDYCVEYRYYTEGFNFDFRKDANTHYRKIDQSVGSNFIGDQVYPVSFIGRPFSQWAVFTEYNNKDWVAGTSTRLNINYLIGKSFSLDSKLDFNIISSSGEKSFLYPFYKAGFKFEPIKNTWLSGAVTNSTMNLDKHYTTYYLLKNPTILFEIRKDLMRH